jgi:predicted Zn finger-like uncharacterized protein
MILSCNSCEKKFVVPDQAITSAGRVVQCGSCGNKWKQFPLNKDIKKNLPNKKFEEKKISVVSKPTKLKKRKIKKPKEINLYSPEYLEKKHGISLNNENIKKPLIKDKISFGFYSSLILFLVISITLSKSLYFFQEIIVEKLPFTEFYIDYFFETIRNIFEICKNLISNY